jgi:hypothetical protein
LIAQAASTLLRLPRRHIRKSKFRLIAAALVIGCGLSGPAAWAGYVLTLQEVGPNVVATGSGSIDLTGLTLDAGNFTGEGLMNPSIGFIITGPSSNTLGESFSGILNGPNTFGSGTGAIAGGGGGDLVGLLAPAASGARATLYLPTGYVSDTALSDTSIYTSSSFSSLGVTTGTYEWTWGAGADQNFTLQIGIAAVPEGRTTSLVVLGLGLVAMGRLHELRRRNSTSTVRK